MTIPSNMSKDFVEMVKAIGEAKTKQEEDRIMARELQLIKDKIANPQLSLRKMKEYIIRMIYAEMLGHDASFAHIHAVKFTSQTKLVEKRIAYLAVTLCLRADDDLIILMVNTMQRDLRSTNQLEICAALQACCTLVNAETIPAMLSFVTDLLQHSRVAVVPAAEHGVAPQVPRDLGPGQAAPGEHDGRRGRLDRVVLARGGGFWGPWS
eukprot:gnl/Hemi2/8927_TR3095_c0_g1_i1.p1 gnl/Hemi2/8927_TR3095_c0_g1~~gnl/Hemi2/8927_TR3095_c0_g1_i1.p1  ORF type:complete len:209 (+),score=42.35 gnl/Hemi2/8927_TR3095_c0_g1_i1:89-715(+)